MSIDSTDSLLESLRASKLFAAEGLESLAADLAALGADPEVWMKKLVDDGRLTAYQLRKVVNGRAADLFLGPYVILDKLGEGGMGKVFRARHQRQQREVALKVVREHLLAKPTARGRYEREVQAALVLKHENIVSVHRAGSTDGRYYLEMEFVDGLDITRIVQKYGVLSVSEACEYARQAALGLHHAHELGFVHRDIKPSNIMVSGSRHIPEAAEPAFVKILDMGLVRSIGDEESERSLTRDGTVVGTPDYMAPEQAKNSRNVDRRADLYSLGAAFYFMLTGKPPFPEGTALDKIICHVDRPPPSLSAARADVPRELLRIVERLMAKNPERRFETALELAEELKPLTRFGKAKLMTKAVEAPRSRARAEEETRADEPPTDAEEPPPVSIGWRDHLWTVAGVVIVALFALLILTLVMRVAHR
jgi:eukaryotic-like serine/threonine-protein kinase